MKSPGAHFFGIFQSLAISADRAKKNKGWHTVGVAHETFEIWGILSEKLKAWFEAGVAILPNLIVAILILLLFYLLSRLVSNLLGRFLNRTTDSSNVTKLIQNSVRLLIFFFGLFTALGVLNLDKTVASLLAGAGVIGLAIGFAFQEIAANFFSGILIALKKPFQPGDIVQVESFIGTVRELTLRTTNIMTFNGLEILIPNKNMFTKPVTNFTSTPERRIEIQLAVAYSSDLTRVESVAREAVASIKGRIEGKATEFYFTGFGDSAINCVVYFWVTYPGANNYLNGIHTAIVALKEAFERNEISMPYPTRSLDFDWTKMRDLMSPAEGAAQTHRSN